MKKDLFTFMAGKYYKSSYFKVQVHLAANPPRILAPGEGAISVHNKGCRITAHFTTCRKNTICCNIKESNSVL